MTFWEKLRYVVRNHALLQGGFVALIVGSVLVLVCFVVEALGRLK